MTEYIAISHDWFGYDYYYNVYYPNRGITWEEATTDFELTKEDSRSINVNLICSVILIAVIFSVGYIYLFQKKN